MSLVNVPPMTPRTQRKTSGTPPDDVLVRALSSFLPNIAIEQLQADLGPELPQLPATVCEAAMMFSDASGFTALTEKLSHNPNGAELMCEIMNRFLGAIIEVVHEYGGDVVKFAGDAVSVIFPVHPPQHDRDAPKTSEDLRRAGPPPAESMRCAVARATACACKLHAKLHNFNAFQEEGLEPITLALHIGVGCGAVTQLHLGGHAGRLEFVQAGPAINQSAGAEPLAKSGESCLSPEAWAIIGDRCPSGTPVQDVEPEYKGFVLLPLARVEEEIAIKQDVCMLSAPLGGGSIAAPPPPMPLASAAHLLPRLIRYVPTAVRARLKQGIVSNLDLHGVHVDTAVFAGRISSRWLRAALEEPTTPHGGARLRALQSARLFGAVSRLWRCERDAAPPGPRDLHTTSRSEMRSVSLMFINCKGLQLAVGADGDLVAPLAAGQTLMETVLEEVDAHEGQVNKMLVDDKGQLVLAVFGLPPRPHSDDPLRALRVAMHLTTLFDGSDTCGGVKACIGVGSGRAFCGVVGSTERREFTTMGDVVNVSARLMQQASKADAKYAVLVDEATSEEAKNDFNFRLLPPVKLKGKANALALFAPVGERQKKKEGGTIGRQGRDKECVEIRSMVAELLVYKGGGTIMMLGGRGSGKAVLVKALTEQAGNAQLLTLTSTVSDEVGGGKAAKEGASAVKARARNEARRASCMPAGKGAADAAAAAGGGGECPSRSNSDGAEGVDFGARSYRPKWFQLSLREAGEAGEATGVTEEGLGFFAWRDVLVQLLDNSAEAKERGREQLVEAALRAEPPLDEDSLLLEGLAKAAKAGGDPAAAAPPVPAAGAGQPAGPESPRMASPRTAAARDRRRSSFPTSDPARLAAESRDLPRWAWLLNELLPEARLLELAAPSDLRQISLAGCCALLTSMIVALLRHVSSAPMSAPASLATGGAVPARGQPALVLLHLQTGTSTDQKVDLWSWRTASAVSAAVAEDPSMRVLLAVVTRQLTLTAAGMQSVARESSDEGEDPRAEMHRLFHDLMCEAETSSSLVSLKPLTHEARERYLLEVLHAKYRYHGELQGVPKELVRFMSERAAGNPKYIVEVLDTIAKAGLLQIDSEDSHMLHAPEPAALEKVEVPPKMKATVMQQYDGLDPSLQLALRVASPLDCFSVGMLADVGLPLHVFKRLTQIFLSAEEEGILEPLKAVPPEVRSADPDATRAWGWAMYVMRDLVLASLLKVEKERVLDRVQALRTLVSTRKASQKTLVNVVRMQSNLRRGASVRGAGMLGKGLSRGRSSEHLSGGSVHSFKEEEEEGQAGPPTPTSTPSPRAHAATPSEQNGRVVADVAASEPGPLGRVAKLFGFGEPTGRRKGGEVGRLQARVSELEAELAKLRAGGS